MTKVKRSESFDKVAQIYDLARPGYPLQLVDDIINMANLPSSGKILDIGPGTGKGTILFAQKGHPIHCIEPGENLIAIAKKHLSIYPKVTFDTMKFEDWELQANTFDLAISAQAFHWVNREIGFNKVARALKERGHIAFFWNFTPPSDAPIFKVLEEAYQKYVPSTSTTPSISSLIEKRKNWILNSNHFTDLVIKEYPWSIELSGEQYLNLIQTKTIFQKFNDKQKQDLSREIIKIISDRGGSLTRSYLSVLFFAQKK